jgi:hypothetical protein
VSIAGKVLNLENEIQKVLIMKKPTYAKAAAGEGGEGGIRTRDRVSPIHTFQACSFNHSDTSPKFKGGKNTISI